MTNTIEVEVPHEIMDYQSKVIFGLTLRQFVASLLVLFLVIPTYVVLNVIIDVNNQIANMVIMLMSAPILAYGFIQKDGFTFAEIVKIKRAYQSCYKKRRYQVEPLKQEKFKYQKTKKTELMNHFVKDIQSKKIENKQRKIARKSIRVAKKATNKKAEEY